MLKYMRKLIKGEDLFVWAYILICVGLLLLFTASRGVFVKEVLFLKQFLWLILSTFTAIFIRRLDYRNFQKATPLLYIIIVFLLFTVLLMGRGSGVSRWIRLGWFNFQPSEFAKLITVITLSAYFAEKDVRRLPVLLFGLILVGLPFIFVLRQPDLGTAFIFIVIFFAIFYQAGGTRKQIISLLVTGIISSPVLWFTMKAYQQERILTFINPMRDPLGKGYNLIQSIITIGSGGFWGRGFLRGTQTKLAFLPEYHTDFIFCVLAEEFGFFGVLLIIFLYFVFFRIAAEIISSTRDRFAQLMGTGILSIFIAQVVVNMSMTMGLFPVVGIPLPFISYGGSSLIVSILSVALLVNIKENSLMF
jgi:rod shape determining protein RodA